MTDEQKTVFFSACEDEVCVSYTVRRSRSVIAIVGLGLVAASGLASAQDDVQLSATPGSYTDQLQEIEIIAGGTKRGQQLEWLDETEAASPSKAELPTIEASEWLPAPSDT
jgi:hypothetical protein